MIVVATGIGYALCFSSREDLDLTVRQLTLAAAMFNRDGAVPPLIYVITDPDPTPAKLNTMMNALKTNHLPGVVVRPDPKPHDASEN